MQTLELSERDIEEIKNFRYQTNGATLVEVYGYEHFWNFVANYCLPDKLAPNLLTLLGLLLPIISMAVVGFYDYNFYGEQPAWIWMLCFAAQFWFQTIDAIDGKQARRINCCSPLGQILDHSLDQITATAIMMHICGLLTLQNDWYRMMMLVPAIMGSHYSIEYRTHFTNYHNTVVGLFGATEQLICIQLGTLVTYFASNSNGFWMHSWVYVPYLEMELAYRDILLVFVLVSGLHYVIENIYYGYLEAKDKQYAIQCLIPYIQFFAMLRTASNSFYWNDYPFFFLLMAGMHLTWVNAIFNLCSTSRKDFPFGFREPMVIMITGQLEAKNILPREYCFYIYCAFCVVTVCRYTYFMSQLTSKLCAALEINFLTVTPPKTPKKVASPGKQGVDRTKMTVADRLAE